MKPAPFDYVRAYSVEHAVTQLAAADGDGDGEGKIICTPGLLISALHLLAENPNPSREDIRAGLSGNICRCTGYAGIVDAVRQAATQA